ncbi:MAG TPA: hypothetical protein VJ793_01605 [Anaerolineae bacterium]|nr:hypothetical protein [Anaerolineae bacterium]
MQPETIQTILGAVLTFAVLSYLIGDNAVYRLAMHVLVGVGAAYAVGVAIGQVLAPRMFAPLLNRPAGGIGPLVFALFGLLGCVFLLAKIFPRTAWLGNVAVGTMLGVGAGVAVGGALFGTLLPQTSAAAGSLGPREAGGIVIGLLLLASTVTTLLAFTYRSASRRTPLGAIGLIGRGFLYVALGATFALVFISGASVLVAWMRNLYSFAGG